MQWAINTASKLSLASAVKGIPTISTLSLNSAVKEPVVNAVANLTGSDAMDMFSPINKGALKLTKARISKPQLPSDLRKSALLGRVYFVFKIVPKQTFSGIG